MCSKEKVNKYLGKFRVPFNSILKNGDKADYFEGLDIERPDSLTPTEVELRIQADRVMFCLNKAISMLYVTAHLPYLLENKAHILTSNLTKEQLDFIKLVFNLYENPGALLDAQVDKGEIFNMINKTKQLKDRIIRSYGNEPKVDANLLQVIDIIFTNKCIREQISIAQNPPTIQYIIRFIKDFEELKAMAKIKLYITGTEEEARDKRLRRAYKSNLMLTAAIKDLEQQLQILEEQQGSELSKKVYVFDKYNEKIDAIKEEFQINIEKTIHESEKNMMQQCLESESKQLALAEESEAITKKYEDLVQDHLTEEKIVKAKTMKIESQLQSWLTKYDQDMGERQSEYEILKKQYDEEKAEMDELQEKLDEIADIYETLMAEKEAEEERIYQEIAFKFLCQRSARIIQRAWRAHIERKKARRKGKKGKKGKEGKKSEGKKTH